MSSTDMVPVAEQAIERSGSIMPHGGAGALALAQMTDAEFEHRLADLKRGQDRIKRIKTELMERDVHYGVIPGTNKPSLLKPGAEVLLSIYGLRPDFIATVEHGDGVSSPDISVTMRCELHLGDLEGPIVAVGVGGANSWEKKHRYRSAERVCPNCGVIGSVFKSKKEGEGFYCWSKKDGCGAQFAADDSRIASMAKVDNPDPYELQNTLLKMSKKRSLIDATLTGTASSDLFTQDISDDDPKGDEPRDDDRPRSTTSQPPASHDRPQAAPPAAAKPRAPMPACPTCGSDEMVVKAQYKLQNGEFFCKRASCKTAGANQFDSRA